MKSKTKKILKEVRVRRMRRKDCAFLADWYSVPHVRAGLQDENISDLNQARKLQALSGADAVADGEAGYVFMLGDKPVAFAHLMWINWIGRTAEIDFMLNPKESPRLFLVVPILRRFAELAFNDLGLNKIYGFVYESNYRSLRLFKKILRVEAILKAYLRRDGKTENVYIISALPRDFTPIGENRLVPLRSRGSDVVAH
jgi:RimJ/RimL family protein N-acetyltransferase